MRRLLHALAVLVLPVLSACTIPIETNPDSFNLEPAALTHLSGAKGVALENAYKADAPLNMRMGQHTWVLEQKKMTDTAIAMLRRALDKQGMGAGPQAPKIVTLRVTAPRATMQVYPGFANTFATVTLDAEFGDGARISIIAENRSPAGAQRAFDGAILFALNKLLVDEKFVAYIKR